jgi:carbon-monoxide dehydrogenase iron sulfur subunit
MDVIYVKPDKCMGCKSCEIGCAVQHSEGKTLFSALLEIPAPMKRLFVETAEGVKMPILCRHCDDAPCLNACISGCLYKDENGFIRRKKERCVGCWTCLMVCPFGVVTRDVNKHLAVKCDRCHKLDVPACVTACPTKALVVKDLDQIPKEKRQNVIFAETG